MKTIGLLGGMSWESTALYYKAINQGVRDSLGGSHSAKIVLHSVDFHEIESMQERDDWSRMAEILLRAARGLETAGAEHLLICTNTMHRVAPEIESGLAIPLIHIVDAVAARLAADSVSRAGLLGTRFTMEDGFFTERLASHGIDAVVPERDDREAVHRVIYQELVRGVIDESSRNQFRGVIGRLADSGAEAVILGCTEIPLLISQVDSLLPIYDTTAIHAAAAVKAALAPA